MRSWLLIIAWVGLVLVGTVRAGQAQSADSLQVDSLEADPAKVTVPVPVQGLLYLRMGTPGGVHIHSRRGTPRPESVARRESERVAESMQETQAAPPPAGLAQRDVQRLEERLDAVEDRLMDRVDAIFRQLYSDLGNPGPAGRTTVSVRQGQEAAAAQPAAPAPTLAIPSQAQPAAQASGPPDAPATVTPPVIQQPDALPEIPPSLVPVVREVERAILETGLFRTLDVLFETDEAALLPRSQRTLDAVGAVLQKYPALRLEVGGHADSRGPAAYNLELSEARAASVRDYLLAEFPGIEPSRITAEGYGETRPIASNDTETGRTLNRRVEFVVLDDGDEAVPDAEDGAAQRP